MTANDAWYIVMFAWGMITAWAVIKGFEGGRTMMRKLVVLLLALSLSCNAFAYDGSNIAREVASVLRGKAVARGLAASDPRVTGLVSAAGTAVTEIAVGVAVAGTAPAWGTLLASAAIAGVVGYGIQVLAGYLFNKDGTVNVPAQGAQAPQLGSGQCFRSNFGGSACWSSIIDAITGGTALSNYTCGASGPKFQLIGSAIPGAWTLEVRNASNNNLCMAISDSVWMAEGSPRSLITADALYMPNSTPPQTQPVGDALEALPELQKGLVIPAKTIADIADAVWQHAASKPGYSGVPYSFSDPVTEADVQSDRAANPGRAVPRVGDLTSPISTTNPLAEPADSPVNDPVTNPSTQPQVNLGNDPVIGAPTLETIPTAQQIIDPLAGLAPSLKNWTVPAHVAECPKPAFDLFNKHIVMDQQCYLFEDNRAVLYNAMLVVWLLISLFIVLSA